MRMRPAGEESEIVIISLVRSNPEGKAGFLNTINRVNVLLSRCRESDLLACYCQHSRLYDALGALAGMPIAASCPGGWTYRVNDHTAAAAPPSEAS